MLVSKDGKANQEALMDVERVTRGREIARAGAVDIDARGRYRVRGNRGQLPYIIDLNAQACTCPDFQDRILRGRAPEGVTACKHIIAAQIVESKARASVQAEEQMRRAEALVEDWEQSQERRADPLRGAATAAMLDRMAG